MKLFFTMSLIYGTSVLLANPEGVHTVFGEAVCTFPNAHTLEVTTGHEAILEWQTFSIESHETTRFVMPSDTSRVLNRVMSGNLTEILGTLESNGQLYLINPNGVFVGEGTIINTASFIASSFDIINDDFLQGNIHNLCQNSGNVINLGSITANDGFVHLIGNKVEHSGSIHALKTENRDGRVFLVGGTVELIGNAITLEEHAYINASGTHGGGTVLIGGDYQGANPAIYNASSVFTHATATIDANALLEGDGGRVIVWANHKNSFFGTVQAQGGSEGGNGGFVEVSSPGFLAYHGLANTIAPFGKTGTLLLDPSTITISTDSTTSNTGFDGSCGTNTYCSTDNMDATLNNVDLSVQLLFSDVTVHSTGDINVTASVNGVSTLVLDADGNINIGGTGIADLITIRASTLTLTADGDITLQGGSGSVAFISLSSANTSLSGNSIFLLAGTGDTSFISISSYDTDLTLTASDSITMTGSDMGLGAGVNLNTSNGALNLTADSGSISLTSGNQTSSGISIHAGSELSITANTTLDLTSNTSSTVNLISNGNTNISAMTLDMTGGSISQQTNISNSSGDLTINANDVNLNSFANITLSDGFGDFNLTATGDVLISGGCLISNQSSGTTTTIHADGTITLQGVDGDAVISNYTSDFNLTAGTDLFMTASSNGTTSITTVSATTLISSGRNITISGDRMSTNTSSILSNDGNLTISAETDISISDYAIIETTFNDGMISINPMQNLTVDNHVVIGHLNQGSLEFHVGGNANITAGADGFIAIFSPTSLALDVSGTLTIASSSTGGVSINADGDVTTNGFLIDLTGFDSSNIVNISSDSGNMTFTSTTTFNLNQNAQINLTDGSGSIQLMTGTNFTLADNSFIQSSSTGTLSVTTNGTTTLSSMAGSAVIQSMNSDVALFSGDTLTMTSSSNGSPQMIGITGLSITGGSNILMTGDSTFPVVINSFQGPMSLTAATDLTLANNTNISITTELFPMAIEATEGTFSISGSYITQSEGDMSIIAGNDIVFDTTSIVAGAGNVVFVVDNLNPTSPDIGTGAFVYPLGAATGAGSGMYMRIYTAEQSLNMIDASANINGLNYVASPEFDDTSQEFWGVYYPDTPAPTPAAPFPDGTDSYTIYYKNLP